MRRLLWLPVVALLVLAARWLCYALAAPSPLSGRLEASAGGPRMVVVTLVSASLAVALSVFAVWLAALGVRERARLRPERVEPSIRLRRLAFRFAALYVTSSFAFAMFESYLHWRAGIGFHGLSCLVRPVAKSKVLQQFTLSVPTEEANSTTTQIELTVPSGFAVDSFEPSPGWKRTEQSTGSGEETVVQKVTWSGGKVPTGEDSVFRFNASLDSNKTYV